MGNSYRTGPFLARVLISIIFIISGFGKLSMPEHAAEQIAGKGIPMAMTAALAAGALELVCGGLLAVGLGARGAAMLLFLFLIPTTILFHNPFPLVGAARRAMEIQLLKNLAIMGGLLDFASRGPGPLSLDNFRRGAAPVQTM